MIANLSIAELLLPCRKPHLAPQRYLDIMWSVIIDFHTHVYPDSVAASVVAAVTQRSHITPHADGTLRGLLDSMDRAVIDVSVVCTVVTRPQQVTRIHRWLQGIKTPRIYPLATLHPRSRYKGERAEELWRQGYTGFKLHPDYQSFYVDDRRMFPLYEAAEGLGMFLLFHAGVDRGLPDPIHCTPRRLRRVHEAFPKLSIIAAHFGGEDAYDETEEYLLGHDIYFDTSFVLRKMPVELIPRIFERHSIERILFATDSPWADQKQELEFFLRLPFLTAEAKDKVLCANALRLMNCDPIVSPTRDADRRSVTAIGHDTDRTGMGHRTGERP